MGKKPWDGRFSQDTDAMVERFTSSIDVDKELYAYDIEGSIAHLTMLAHGGIITEDEAAALREGLGRVKEKISNNELEFSDTLEDIHMHVESALGDEAGNVARKLHTGRSRNDQVALDARMYLKAETLAIIEGLFALQKVLVEMAEKHKDVVMPGYTHMQRAQPVLFAHHLMAYYEMFKRDRERMEDSLKRTDVMPLGSAALAGTTFPLNRELTRKLLGFAKVSDNSMDSVSDRDFSMEFISAASICMIHLSRFSEELVLWSSSEFAFITISDAFTTGSSIMPQKKNPDVAELVRGKTARVVGNLMAIITLMKSLPLAYNRDMQEDKEPLFDTVNTLKACVDIYTRMLPNIKVNKETMLEASQHGFLNATDLADYLVVKGVPFREAHSISGKSVAYALENNKELHDLTVDEFKKFSDLIDSDVFEFLSIEKMISRRVTHGGTGYDNVQQAIKQAEQDLKRAE
ncbi:MAG: argininosuccinate lyase [Desulfobacterium sp.]|nr:argininosuccinate lyase [Desulfobacterium sp.]